MRRSILKIVYIYQNKLMNEEQVLMLNYVKICIMECCMHFAIRVVHIVLSRKDKTDYKIQRDLKSYVFIT